MGKMCKYCHTEVTELYDGKCANCLANKAIKRQTEEDDYLNDTGGLQINTPITQCEYVELITNCCDPAFKRLKK